MPYITVSGHRDKQQGRWKVTVDVIVRNHPLYVLYSRPIPPTHMSCLGNEMRSLKFYIRFEFLMSFSSESAETARQIFDVVLKAPLPERMPFIAFVAKVIEFQLKRGWSYLHGTQIEYYFSEKT